MLSFEVARLLDEPNLDIFTFFPDYCTDSAKIAERRFTIYVVRDGDVVFYVGKSDDDCFARLRSHLGFEFRGHRSLSALGGLITRNLPESRMWCVNLYTNEETKKIVPKRFYEDLVRWPTKYAEEAMIQTLEPCLNVMLNCQNQRMVPDRYR